MGALTVRLAAEISGENGEIIAAAYDELTEEQKKAVREKIAERLAGFYKGLLQNDRELAQELYRQGILRGRKY